MHTVTALPTASVSDVHVVSVTREAAREAASYPYGAARITSYSYLAGCSCTWQAAGGLDLFSAQLLASSHAAASTL